MQKMGSTLFSTIILTFVLMVNSFELPKFGKGFDLKLIPEDVKKGFEKLGEFSNLTQIKSLLDQFKVDYIPDLNEMQKNSTNSCIQFGKNLATKVYPAKFRCLKEIPKNLIAKARTTRDILPPCYGKCVGMELKILDGEGKPDLMYTKQWIAEIVPPLFMDYVVVVYEKCHESIMAIKGDDPTCETHRVATKCVTNAVSEFSMEALKLCPDIPDGWKRLIEAVASNTKDKE